MISQFENLLFIRYLNNFLIKIFRCGTQAVVVLWDMTIEMVSVNGESRSFYLDSTSHLVQEIDGVRIIGSTSHDLLQKVNSKLIFFEN